MMRLSVAFTAVTMAGLLGLAGGLAQEQCTVRIRLTDARTGAELPGLVRVSEAETGEPVPVAGLLSRGAGLGDERPIRRWSVLPPLRSRAWLCSAPGIPRRPERRQRKVKQT